MLADLVAGQVADERLAGLDHQQRPFVEWSKIVRRVILVLAPVEALASARLPESSRCKLALPWPGWCRPCGGSCGPPNSRAVPKFRQIDLACDVQVAVGLGREPRDDLAAVLAEATSSATMLRMKLEEAGGSGGGGRI